MPNDPNDKAAPVQNGDEIQTAPSKVVSPRKVEANRQNAQHSTGPRTPEGKSRSSSNAATHKIFSKRFLNGADSETIEEMVDLTAGLRAHYEPVGMLEELLMQKIFVETARYCRVLELEATELSRRNVFFNAAIDHVGRYSTSTSRALYRAIDQLEHVQSARKAGENAATSLSRKSVGVAAKTIDND